jgi:prepilin-type N-terminal cleavage/methylation domain-containing protein
MRSRRRGHGSRRGFNLLEVLIGMVVLAVALASAYQLTFATSRLTQRTQNLANATALAEYKLEELRNTDYADIETGADESTLDAMGNAGGQFARAWAVTEDQPMAGLKTVVVAVSWDQLGQQNSYTLTGVIGQ